MPTIARPSSANGPTGGLDRGRLRRFTGLPVARRWTGRRPFVVDLAGWARFVEPPAAGVRRRLDWDVRPAIINHRKRAPHETVRSPRRGAAARSS
jgi:hypothetical protein